MIHLTNQKSLFMNRAHMKLSNTVLRKLTNSSRRCITVNPYGSTNYVNQSICASVSIQIGQHDMTELRNMRSGGPHRYGGPEPEWSIPPLTTPSHFKPV